MQTIAKIDEETRRRPEFAGEVPVVLCDGQTWHLPKPRINLAPRRIGGKFEIRPEVRGWGDEYYQKLDALELAYQHDDTTEILNAQMDLCCALILKNYDLADEELARVLWFDSGDEANTAMRDTLLRTAQGNAPNPAGVGSSAT